MRRTPIAILVLLGATLVVLLSACNSPYAPTPTTALEAGQEISPSATEPPLQETDPAAEPAATLPPPEEMPTAMPIWTVTPAPAATEAPAEASPAERDLGPTVIAVVNGTPVLREDFDVQLVQAEAYFVQQPGFDPNSPAGQQSLLLLREQVLDWMIDQVLIQQAAAAQGVSVTQSAVDAEVRRIRGSDLVRYTTWLQANGLTEESLRQQIRVDLLTNEMRDRTTKNLQQRAAQVHIRHILLSSEDAATSALQRLQAGADFAALAREISEDEGTRTLGGDLGYMPRGIMPPPFDEAAFALKAGETSGIVRSDYGYHIINVVDVDPDRQVPDELWPVVQQLAFDDWLRAQRDQADLLINTDIIRG